MGLISFIKNKINQRRTLRLTQSETFSFVEKLQEIEEKYKDNSNKFKQETIILVENFKEKVKSGNIDLGGTEEEQKENSHKLIRRYFYDNEKVLSALELKEGNELVNQIVSELNDKTKSFKDIDLDQVIKDINNFKKSNKKESNIKEDLIPKTLFQQFEQISGFMKEYSYNEDVDEDISILKNKYKFDVLRELDDNLLKNEEEAVKLYEEYTRDFLSEEDKKHDYAVRFFSNDIQEIKEKLENKNLEKENEIENKELEESILEKGKNDD